MHWDTFKQDKLQHSWEGGGGVRRVSKVQATTTSPMPGRKGFKLQ